MMIQRLPPFLCPTCETPIYQSVLACPTCDAPIPASVWNPEEGWTNGKRCLALLLSVLMLLIGFVGTFGGMAFFLDAPLIALAWSAASAALLVACLWGARALRRSVQRGNEAKCANERTTDSFTDRR